MTSDLPLVSGVIPTYNYGEFVCDAVDSALGQTYENMEVIVVDDGSTDDTRERLEPYMDRLRYIYQENQGLSAARNTGIRAAEGEWIALLDSDDVWREHKVEAQVRAAAEKEWTLVLCHSGGGADCRIEFEEMFFIAPNPSSWLVNTGCFQEAGYFDEKLTSVEDRDMLLRIGRSHNVGVVRGDYVTKRAHEGQMSSDAERMKRNYTAVVDKAFGWPEMQKRLLLRAKIRSYVNLDAAREYLHTSLWNAARELLFAVLRWPLPGDRLYARPLERVKLAGRIGLEALGLWDRLSGSERGNGASGNVTDTRTTAEES